MLDVVHRVLDRLDLLGVFLGDLDLELGLEREHELDDRQGVRLQIVDERRLRAQLLFRDLELTADDFLDLFFDLYRRHGFLALEALIVQNGRYINSPPLTRKTWPVMYPASGPARNAAAPATSSAWPILPSGICSSNLPRWASG